MLGLTCHTTRRTAASGEALPRPAREGLKVVPRCEFVAAYVERHPEYRDLLADKG